MNRNFSIRSATNADVSVIKEIVFHVLIEYGLPPDPDGKDNDLSDVEKHYLQSGGYFGVVEDLDSKKIIGTFGIYPLSAEECELRKMYLLKSYRGMGVGKMMLEKAIHTALESGFTTMRLETISPLQEAISLYRKYGFHEIPLPEKSDRVDQAFELHLLK